ncbi:MAG: LysM peptidoglycan-binding domain-containing protein [Anaerolineales bacterium]|nr:MAG: LysM peptidoglycan-binding domain-containing protein [Anaerolineales bacterium]
MTKKKPTKKSTSGQSSVPTHAAQYLKQAEDAKKERQDRDQGPRGLWKRSQQAAAKGKKRTYVVKSGDSLSKIAGELLGDIMRWPEIHEANKDQIKNPDLIRAGQKLVIPEK